MIFRKVLAEVLRMRIDLENVGFQVSKFSEVLEEFTAATQDAFDVANKLARAEHDRQTRSARILMVSTNPRTGDLDHKFFTKLEFEAFWGKRYTDAVFDFLQSVQISKVAYMDGAFIAWVSCADFQHNVKKYKVR